jgi:hypothetical protein
MFSSSKAFTVGSTTTLAPILRSQGTSASTPDTHIAVENVVQHTSRQPTPDRTPQTPTKTSIPHSPLSSPRSSLESNANTESSSSSDSDLNFRAYNRKLKMASSSQNSVVPIVEHHSLHHAPILTAGIPTPAILLEFEDACEDFFANAKGGVTDEQKVTRILPSFKDPIIRGWISSDRAHLSKLSFALFMTDLRAKFLSKEWEDELLSKILRNHLRPNQDFMTWATMLQQQNCILRNTTSQLDEKRLREQISIAVDMELRIAGREAKVNEAESLRDFLHIYSVCDDKRKAAETRTRSI